MWASQPLVFFSHSPKTAKTLFKRNIFFEFDLKFDHHIPVLQQDKNALFISFLPFTYIIIIIFSQEGEGQAFVPCCVI